MSAINYVAPGSPNANIIVRRPPEPPDGTAVVPAWMVGEKGASWGEDRLFAFYENELIFMRGAVEDLDLEMMLRVDGKARSIEQVLTLPLRGAKWQIDPAKADAGEAEFTDKLLTTPASAGGMRTPIQMVIGQMTSACLFRQAFFEKVFRLEDGKVVYDKLAFRPATTCYLARSARTAEQAGFLQWTWIDQTFQQIYVPFAKSFTFIHGLHRNPLLGITDLDVCYRAFDTKQKLRFLWSQFLENQTIPKALAKHSSTGDEEGAGNLARKVATLKGGGVIGLMPGQDVEAFESNGKGAETFLQAIAYLDSEMSMSVLAGFMDLTSAAVSRGVGSYALSLSATDFYLQGREAVLGEMGEAITNDVIAPMIRWNFGRKAAVPTFRFTDLASTTNTTEAVLSLLQAAAQAQPNKDGAPTVLPMEFVNELIEKVSGLLGLDVGVVAKAVRDRTEQIRAGTTSPSTAASAPLHAAADVGAAALAEAGGGHGNSDPTSGID